MIKMIQTYLLESIITTFSSEISPFFLNVLLTIILLIFSGLFIYSVLAIYSLIIIMYSSDNPSSIDKNKGKTADRSSSLWGSNYPSDPGKPEKSDKPGTIGDSTTTGVITFATSLITKVGLKRSGLAGGIAKLGHEGINVYNRNPEGFKDLAKETGRDLGRSFSEHMHGSKDDLAKTLGQHSKDNLPSINSDSSTYSPKMTSPLEQSYPITDGSIFEHDIWNSIADIYNSYINIIFLLHCLVLYAFLNACLEYLLYTHADKVLQWEIFKSDNWVIKIFRKRIVNFSKKALAYSLIFWIVGACISLLLSMGICLLLMNHPLPVLA